MNDLLVSIMVVIEMVKLAKRFAGTDTVLCMEEGDVRPYDIDDEDRPEEVLAYLVNSKKEDWTEKVCAEAWVSYKEAMEVEVAQCELCGEVHLVEYMNGQRCENTVACSRRLSCIEAEEATRETIEGDWQSLVPMAD